MAHEPYLYMELYQTKFRHDDTKIFQIFGVSIGDAKIIRKVQFHLAASVMKCLHNSSKSSSLCTLASAFHCTNDKKVALALVNSIEESLTLEKENCKNIIHFDNANMSNRRKIKVEQNLRYNLMICSKNEAFDILNDISENVSLVQIMYSLGNVNHAINIVGH